MVQTFLKSGSFGRYVGAVWLIGLMEKNFEIKNFNFVFCMVLSSYWAKVPFEWSDCSKNNSKIVLKNISACALQFFKVLGRNIWRAYIN